MNLDAETPKMPDLTVGDVKLAVASIAKITADDEAAHADEDALWARVLGAIAAGHPDPAGLAKAALETKHLSFSRWCA